MTSTESNPTANSATIEGSKGKDGKKKGKSTQPALMTKARVASAIIVCLFVEF